MNRTALFSLAFLLPIVTSSLCAQETAPDPYDLLQLDQSGEQDQEPWTISVGAQSAVYTFIHSALQRRADSSSDQADNFRDNEADGTGWGVLFSAKKGDGAVVVDFLRSEYEYMDSYSNGFHRIETDRTDFQVYWEQITGRNSNGYWGWNVGARWLGESVRAEVNEGSASLSGDDSVNWLLLKTGYWGELAPWDGNLISAHGNINLLIGEVRGLARSDGSDDDPNDGVITETYDTEFSLAYGASALAGITLHIFDQLNVKVEYQREWLYSFEATDSGIVVFPDNDDALYINNSHGVFIYLTYVW